jgi:hypothetical protein
VSSGVMLFLASLSRVMLHTLALVGITSHR